MKAALIGPPGTKAFPNSGGWIPLFGILINPFRRHTVIEVGITSPGQMLPMARALRPIIVVVMSVGSEHSTSFKTLEATRDEKANMVRVLPKSGIAVLNGDDPNVRWMGGETSARVVTFGFDEVNDVRATGIGLDWPEGTHFTVTAWGETRVVRTRLLGRVTVYSALAALAVALCEGVRLDEAAVRVEALEPTPRAAGARPAGERAQRGGMVPGCITHARSYWEAVEALERGLGPGDVVLIKGRTDQRLGRIALALMGHQARCGLVSCRMGTILCESCPMLTQGWRDDEVARRTSPHFSDVDPP